MNILPEVIKLIKLFSNVFGNNRLEAPFVCFIYHMMGCDWATRLRTMMFYYSANVSLLWREIGSSHHLVYIQNNPEKEEKQQQKDTII